eukprot:scaffold396_cov127-Isochrysis_galbana.AAC.9
MQPETGTLSSRSWCSRGPRGCGGDAPWRESVHEALGARLGQQGENVHGFSTAEPLQLSNEGQARTSGTAIRVPGEVAAVAHDCDAHTAERIGGWHAADRAGWSRTCTLNRAQSAHQPRRLVARDVELRQSPIQVAHHQEERDGELLLVYQPALKVLGSTQLGDGLQPDPTIGRPHLPLTYANMLIHRDVILEIESGA